MAYLIDTVEFLKTHGGNEQAAVNDLLRQVRSGEIPYPYNSYFAGDPQELFNNIKTTISARVVGKYDLRSYFPKHRLYLPPLFRGNYLSIEPPSHSYFDSEVLSDLFVQDLRIKVRRYGQKLSSAETWLDDNELRKILALALKEPIINPKALSQVLYKNVAEASTFRTSWIIGLIEAVIFGKTTPLDQSLPDWGKISQLRWLDISSGWGDRLLAACAFDIAYVGYDPNLELKPRHDKMIELFGTTAVRTERLATARSEGRGEVKQKIIYEPFETANVEGEFDFVLTSPPFYDVEDYSPGQPGQSLTSYPDFPVWMVHFLFAAIDKACRHIKKGGYLILHLGDSQLKDYTMGRKVVREVGMAEPLNLFIEKMIPDASWEGIIGLTGRAGYSRPAWVWKMDGVGTRWNPVIARNLTAMYPELAMEWIRYKAGLVNPAYKNARRISPYQVKHASEIAQLKEKFSRTSTSDVCFEPALIDSLLDVRPVPVIEVWIREVIKLLQ